MGLIDCSGQDKLSQLCVLFKIPEADVQNKSRLTLTSLFITELEKQLSALRPDEIIPFLGGCEESVSWNFPINYISFESTRHARQEYAIKFAADRMAKKL